MSAGVNLSNNFKILYDDVKEGISILLQKARGIYGNVDLAINKLREVFQLEFSKEDSVVTNIAGLLSQISVLAYLQEFSNDKNFDKLRDYYAENPDKTFASIKLDFKFGFADLLDLIQCGVEMLESNEVGKTTVEGRLTANLLSNIRDVTSEEYLTGGYIEKDLALLVLLNESPDEDYNKDILDFIKSNDDLNTIYSTARDSILGVYRYAFQDGFGLRPYVGVVSFSGNSIMTIGDDYHLSTLPSANSVFKKVASELSEEYPVEQSESRQFDFDAIVNSSKPVYFPKKILEYSMGRQLTYEMSMNLYRPLESANSWDDYEKGYVYDQIDRECFVAVYKSLQRHTGKDFSVPVSSEEMESLRVELSNMSLHDKVKNDMQKVIRSLCTGVVVTSYNSLNNSVNSIALRVIDVYKSLSLSITGKLFGSFSSNMSISFYDGLNLTTGKTLRDGNTPLPYNVIEFRHDFNEKLTEAEPLFGYTAVELFRKRGIPIEWGRILLGEDIKGTPIFADISDKDGIPLQANAVHNMIAGSRSGKGVMTMNILSVGLGSGKPIFYIDRKPDMAVMFYEMTDGNMFIVNGGQYLSKNDPRGIFSDKGKAINGWDTAYNSMPSYLKKVFKKNTYAGDFGDYVYFRSMLFCICLVLARAEFASEPNIYEKLGGDNGVVFVFDEFKNWQENFEQVFFTPNGVFGENRIEKSMREQYNKNKFSIEDKIDALNSGIIKPERVRTVEREISNLKKANENLIKPMDAYGTTVMDKYGQTIKAVSSLLSAGFKDGEAPKTDIFVIGQHIEIDGYDGSLNKSGTYTERDSGKFNSNAETKGKSLMRGLLDSFFHDWFMGYNADGKEQKEYMGASVSGSESERLIAKKRYWGYTSGSSMEQIRNANPSNTIYFKPYLVLNNAMEDDPNNPEKITDSVTGNTVDNPDYAFVKQCRDRVNEAVPNLWETVRLKHLVSGCEVTDENKWYGHLNSGIGFEGLANAVCQTQGKTLDKARTLSASKTIADYVAQQMGYSNYKELLFDFSPAGLFSSEDVIFAIKNGAEAYRNSLETRLPLFKEYNLLDTEEDGNEDSMGYDGDMYSQSLGDDDLSFGDISSDDGYDSSSDGMSFEGVQSNTSIPQPNGVSQAQQRASSYYADNGAENDTVEKSQGFTREMAVSFIEQVLRNYDQSHQDNPIRHLVSDYEIDSLADMFVSIMND